MLVFAATGIPTIVFLAALILTIGILLFRSQRYFARQSRSSPPSYRPAPPPDPPLRGPSPDGPAEKSRWEVQMHEFARELSGQLDSKMGALGQLIREADRASARLEAALAASHGLAQSTAAGDARPALDQAATNGEATLPEPADQAQALKWASRPDGTSPRPGTAEQEPADRPTPERRYEEIYLLADYGFDPGEIARRVGTPVGEVQLILGLRKKRSGT